MQVLGDFGIGKPAADQGEHLAFALGDAVQDKGGSTCWFGAGLLSPVYPGIGLHATVFFAVRPDLAYLQISCYLGAVTALAGLIVLRIHGGDRTVFRAGSALAAGGLALIAAAALGAHQSWTVPLGYVMYCGGELDIQAGSLWSWPLLPRITTRPPASPAC